jgi:hypothetical protein
MTELHRQAFATVATVAVIASYASGPFPHGPPALYLSPALFPWAMGLLVAAPVLRHYYYDTTRADKVS